MSEKLGIKEDGQPYRVLVVDDSPIIHKLISRTLEPQRFLICAFGNNGKEGVELYKQYNPDLVTMDVTMPIKDGIQAATEIFEINPNAKILMLSAMGDEVIVEEAKRAGITWFATKPFKEEEFLEIVCKILNK